MKKRNIVLVGFMGAGKSMVAKELANRQRRDVLSTDELIKQREKKTIREIFKESGEEHFRELERDAVREASGKDDVIIDCGGGVVLNPDNIKDLGQTGTIFYLSGSPEVLYQRVKGKRHRPLLNVKDPKAKIEEILKVRKPLYEQADFTINTDRKTVPQVCEEIINLLPNE